MMKKRLLNLGIALTIGASAFAQTARVQVIHNSADMAAATVDVWLNETLLLDNFAFRTASPFIDAPAGVDFVISVQPPNSTDTTNALAQFTYNLTAGETYVLVANGTVSPTGYMPVQPFNLNVFAGAQEASGNPANTNVLVYHGATDAPTVDITAGATTLVNNISYSEFDAAYLQLPTADYVLNVTDASGAVVVASYTAPLATLNLEGASLVALASGFLDTSMNSNGASFGIWVALPAGGNLIQLPVVPDATPTARVQVIHNCADLAAAAVDVWLNSTLLIDNFAFRTASPFIDAPAGVDFVVSIQPPNSTDTTNALAQFTYNLTENETYVLIANGTVSPTGYTPAQPFNLNVFAGAQEASGNPANTNILVYHGATDAPTVDLTAGGSTLVDNISYSEFNPTYLQLPTADYSINVNDATGAVTVASYSAPLATLNLQGASLVALASGFLDPSMNSNGAGFGIWVALPAGGNLIPLPVVTGLAPLSKNTINLYPNPANESVQLSGFSSNGNVQVNVYNSVGQRVIAQQVTASNANVISVETAQLAAGFYTLELVTNDSKLTHKFSVSK